LQETSSLREKHFPALDGLRGLAALMVVAFHSAGHYVLTNTFDKAYQRGTSLLWIGVDLFFVLSGFLITNILLDSKHFSNYLRVFYGRRIVRIFPLYYTFLAIIYFLLPALGSHLPKDLTDVQAWLWTYTANINLAFHGWPNGNIGHLWTLAIEEQFYLLWPLIVLLVSERSLGRGIIVTLVALPFIRAAFLFLGFSPMFILGFTLTHNDGLLFGSLISIGIRNRIINRLSSDRVLLTLLDWVVSGIVFSFVLVYCFIIGNDQFIFNFFYWPAYLQCVGFTLISLPMGYAVMRAAASTPNVLQRVLNFKYLRMVGKYSYALYVLHVPICIWAGAHFPVPRFLQNLPSAWSFSYSLYIIIVQFTLSIIAAIISWNVLEKHFLKLKKYFPYGNARQVPQRHELIEHFDGEKA
jgi:peptidoglycan/LPS O-acetylase OafA/YrhL